MLCSCIQLPLAEASLIKKGGLEHSRAKLAPIELCARLGSVLHTGVLQEDAACSARWRPGQLQEPQSRGRRRGGGGERAVRECVCSSSRAQERGRERKQERGSPRTLTLGVMAPYLLLSEAMSPRMSAQAASSCSSSADTALSSTRMREGAAATGAELLLLLLLLPLEGGAAAAMTGGGGGSR